MPGMLYPGKAAADALRRLHTARPLVHCLTNEVVQEITANVLLAAGASPAMVVALEEAPEFTALSGALLINTGTPYPERLKVMKACALRAAERGIPWVLDPVAAGATAWRTNAILSLMDLQPAVIRGNASEILALAGAGTGGKGVDSTDASSAAIDAAMALARRTKAAVCVTGERDYVTDGEALLYAEGGSLMATRVVGTGCSLSALTAAFCAADPNPLSAAAAACTLAKRAAEQAMRTALGPGSFHNAYLDALYLISPEALESLGASSEEALLPGAGQ